MAHSYKGLYYPFIHFKDERWLKMTALYWDRMGRIVPDTYKREDSATVRELGDFIENLRPDWVRPSFGERFTAFVAANARELQGRYAIANRDKKPWPEVPPTQRPPTPGGASGTDPRLSYVFYEKMSPEVQRVLVGSGLAQPDAVDERWIGMHPRLAQVYMTALADQMAGERGFAPLTDETIDLVSVGGNTMERLAQALLGDEVNLADASATAQEVENLAVFVAIQTVLPANIETLPTEKILKFREKYPEARAQFQRYLSDFVKPREWLRNIVDPGVLTAQIESEFAKELKPKLGELREKHRDVGIDTISGVLTMQIGVPALVTQGAALAGVVANPVLALGAGTALALLPVLRDRRKAARDVAAADVSYLLRVERDLAPGQVIGWISRAAKRLRFGKRD